MKLVRKQTLPRRGSVVVIAMICLMLASFLVMNLAKMTFANRSQQRKELQIEQAAWLTEAGVSRAVYHLRTNPNYEGETWTVAAEHLNGFETGEVTISVSADDRSQVTVTTLYPAGSVAAVRRSKTITVSVPSTNGSPAAVAEKPKS